MDSNVQRDAGADCLGEAEEKRQSEQSESDDDEELNKECEPEEGDSS